MPAEAHEDRVLTIVPPSSAVLAHKGPVELYWTSEDGNEHQVLGRYDTIKQAGLATTEFENSGHLIGILETRVARPEPAAANPQPPVYPEAQAPVEGSPLGPQAQVEGGASATLTAAVEEAADRLFNGDAYLDPELRLERVDGLQVDEIALAFTGTIRLDRSNADDVALYKRISRGAAVELQVGCRHAGINAAIAEDDDGARTVTGTKRVKVETLQVIDYAMAVSA
jgi:hypothetical protein